VKGFFSTGGVAAFAASPSLGLSAAEPFVVGVAGFLGGREVVGTDVDDGCGVSGLACVAGATDGTGDAAVGGVVPFGAIDGACCAVDGVLAVCVGCCDR